MNYKVKFSPSSVVEATVITVSVIKCKIKKQQEFTFSDSVCVHKNYSRFFSTIQNKHANCQLAAHQLFSPLF